MTTNPTRPTPAPRDDELRDETLEDVVGGTSLGDMVDSGLTALADPRPSPKVDLPSSGMGKGVIDPKIGD